MGKCNTAEGAGDGAEGEGEWGRKKFRSMFPNFHWPCY